MKWNDAYDVNHAPTIEDIKEFLGEGKPLWNKLTEYIEQTYKVTPQIAYSSCSAQPGWNVKYRKSGKAICTLYPMDENFIALVVVGAKEEDEVKVSAEADVFTEYVKQLYDNTVFSAMGKWLMIEVRDELIINDIKNLIKIRMRKS